LQQAQQSEHEEMDASLVATSQNRNDLAKLLEKFKAGLLIYHEVDLDENEESDDVEKDRYRIYDKGN